MNLKESYLLGENYNKSTDMLINYKALRVLALITALFPIGQGIYSDSSTYLPTLCLDSWRCHMDS